jgi:hypothetical protein
MDLGLRKKLVICYILSIALYGAETWTLLAVDQKHLESSEIRCWRKMEISWPDHVRNEGVLRRVMEQRNILHETSKRKANWIGHYCVENSCYEQWRTQEFFPVGVQQIQLRTGQRERGSWGRGGAVAP